MIFKRDDTSPPLRRLTIKLSPKKNPPSLQALRTIVYLHRQQWSSNEMIQIHHYADLLSRSLQKKPFVSSSPGECCLSSPVVMVFKAQSYRSIVTQTITLSEEVIRLFKPRRSLSIFTSSNGLQEDFHRLIIAHIITFSEEVIRLFNSRRLLSIFTGSNDPQERSQKRRHRPSLRRLALPPENSFVHSSQKIVVYFHR